MYVYIQILISNYGTRQQIHCWDRNAASTRTLIWHIFYHPLRMKYNGVFSGIRTLNVKSDQKPIIILSMKHEGFCVLPRYIPADICFRRSEKNLLICSIKGVDNINTCDHILLIFPFQKNASFEFESRYIN